MSTLISYQSFDFSAVHTLRRLDWSEEQNVAEFGPCCNPSGHGHNFQLTVGFAYDPNEAEYGRGFVYKTLDHYIRTHLDMKSLNDYLRGYPYELATCENVVFKLRENLEKAFRPKGIELKALQLQETRNNFVYIRL